jgi:hypothetical protein
LVAALLVGDLFHPINHFAIELFLNGDECHGCGWRGAMPVLLTGREPDYVARPNFLNVPSPTLRTAAAGCNEQVLPQRMSVPCGASAGLERDILACRACRSRWLE